MFNERKDNRGQRLDIGFINSETEISCNLVSPRLAIFQKAGWRSRRKQHTTGLSELSKYELKETIATALKYQGSDFWGGESTVKEALNPYRDENWIFDERGRNDDGKTKMKLGSESDVR
jgi:hypothetical protein